MGCATCYQAPSVSVFLSSSHANGSLIDHHRCDGTVPAVWGWEGHTPSMHVHVTWRRRESLMKLALVTIVTANLEPMRTFYQQVLQIEPQIYRGHYVEFPL